MKQSTTFAQVATNQFDYLSSALCANTPPCEKHSSSRKIPTLSISLRLLLVMFLTLTVSANAWGAYEKASSIAVGDVVVLVYETGKKELEGISTTSTKYGIGVGYTTTPAGAYELTVEAGSTSGTYSFKCPNGQYLYWSTGNSLATNTTKSANSSWSITFSNGNATIKNAKDNSRKLQWNASSPRFACYTTSQTAVQLYKKVSTQLAKPENLKASNITAYTASLSWNAVANASSYNVVVSDGSSSDIVKEGIVETSITITELSPSTEYYFTVKAIGSGSYQDSDETDSDVFTTNPVYTVSYNYNGSDVAGNPPSDENKYEKGDEITILSKESEIGKEGCYFAGWSTQENGTGTLYQAGDTYTIQGNTIFYAQWVECSEENTPIISIENDNSNNVTILWNEIAGATSYSVYLLDEEIQAYIYNNITSTSKIINIDEIGTAGEYILDVTPYKGNAQIGCGGVAVIVLTENPTYIITIADNIQNGTVTADKSDAAEGEIVTLTATPNTGYAFGSWTVTDASSNTITVTSNTFTMPASDVTISATFEALPTYSIQWLVNSEKAKGTPTTSVIEGQQISNLPTTPTSADCDGVKEFVGWTDEEIIGISATAPTNLYIELEDFPAITKEKIFYAVFANVEGAGSGNYEKLTADLSDWSGEYLIVYEDESVAFNGGLTSLDVASNYISVEIKDNEIERTETTMKACLFVTAVDGGYAIQSASGYFIGHPEGVNSNKLYSNIESIYVNTFEDYNTIKGESAYEIAYNADAGQKRFRYYNSANVEDVALYKKSSYTNYTTSCVTYTVTWKNYDGTIIETDENVWYGTIPTYNGVLPTKPATDQYNYIFAGWTPEVTSVTGDATYTATFSENVNTYTITFQNYDGAELQTSSVEYGITPTYDGATPTKAADAQYTYTFNGWDPAIAPATTDATYTATYTTTINTYTITWQNEDGTTLETDENVPYGETPTYNGVTPTKTATAQYTYTFNAWTPAISTVTGNDTYIATFTETINQYQVTFNMNGHGTEPATQTIAYGSKVSEPSAPTAGGYEFAGWYKDEQCTIPWNFNTDVITGNTAIHAKWLQNFTITWKANGLEYTTTNVTEGEPITPPASPDAGDYCGQVFAGWTDAEMVETTNDAPTLYPNPTPFPTATKETPTTFYAVFADYEN